MLIKDKIARMWLGAAVLVGGLFAILNYCFSDFPWDTFVLMFTASVLVWYSMETRGSRLIALEVKRLSIHPGLTIRYQRNGENQDGDWGLILSNEGNGAALNPVIEVIDSPHDLVFELNGVNAIYPSHAVPISWTHEGKRNDQNIFTLFTSSPLKIRITFSHALDLGALLVTEQELWSPPKSKIVKTVWV